MSSAQPNNASPTPELANVDQATSARRAPAPSLPAEQVKVEAKKVVRARSTRAAAPAGANLLTPTPVATKKADAAAAKEAARVATQVVTETPVLPKVEKLLKEKKHKLVRDSFTIPKLEYLLLDQLKQRGGALGSSVKKSESIRAGIKALAAMPDADFLAAIKAVPTIKTGRPSNA